MHASDPAEACEGPLREYHDHRFRRQVKGTQNLDGQRHKIFQEGRSPSRRLDHTLSEYLAPGGLLIDLAWNIDCCEIVQWCHEHEVLYMNTSVEVWDSYGERFTATPIEKSLYSRQMKLREITKDWKNATTFVVDHGANPGLISHFAETGTHGHR